MSNTILRFGDYLNAAEPECERCRHLILDRFAHYCAGCTGYDELYAAAKRFVDEMRALDYPVVWFDEDGESMVTYLVNVDSERRLVLSAGWDDEEGSTGLLGFSERGIQGEYAFASQ